MYYALMYGRGIFAFDIPRGAGGHYGIDILNLKAIRRWTLWDFDTWPSTPEQRLLVVELVWNDHDGSLEIQMIEDVEAAKAEFLYED
ncbi:hypothetical protein BM477_04815 [Boudabousia marimammalium]|uniref:Uncharacterized protein n=1 Tax=Boudabousia marimammalium TaxID=156892 RepID=A0A1Q5PP64_9ACTO|nr:hypothetical protein BM477_04815 [Boudabousia marimammalium]